MTAGNPSLHEAFSLFTKESLRLEKAYESLRDESNLLKEKLKIQNQLLTRILTHISQGLIFVSSNGLIKIVNRAALKFLELSEKDAVGCSYWSVFSDDFFGFSMRNALHVEDRSKEVLFLTLGDSKEIEVTRTALPAQEGVILLLRELTEEKRLKSLLERNDRLKELGEMAASLAHEIRNPLGGIEGFASLLFDDLKEKPSLQQMVTAILEGTKSLNQLVTNILEYAKPETLHLAFVDLVQVIKRSVSLVEIDRGRKCRFLLDIIPTSVPLYLDSGLMQRALINLLLNAIDASQEGDEIIIHLEVKNKKVVIKVIDKGVGIDKKEQEKLFTPFFTTKSHGTGLGLSEALKAIQTLGGTLSVLSKKGKGTTFTLKIPIIEQMHGH